MRVFLIEDEWLHVEDFRLTLEEVGHELVGYTEDGIMALTQLTTLGPDVVVIDIFLNGRKNGIAIAERIKQEFKTIPIIFLTSQIDDETIAGCIALNPAAYLTKPVRPGDLKAAFAKISFASENDIEKEENFTPAATELLIRVGRQLKPIEFAAILFIQSGVKNYASIHLTNGQKIAIKRSLANLETLLPNFFCRVHKEYIVNSQQVTSINEMDQCVVCMDAKIPIGKTFKREFLAKYSIL